MNDIERKSNEINNHCKVKENVIKLTYYADNILLIITQILDFAVKINWTN